MSVRGVLPHGDVQLTGASDDSNLASEEIGGDGFGLGGHSGSVHDFRCAFRHVCEERSSDRAVVTVNM